MSDATIDLVRPALDPAGLAGLEESWRTLEVQAEPSFFQSWTWVGCRLRERFTRPMLIRARVDDAVVGLALCNRAGRALAPRALHLHETGDAAEDAVFVEHNAPLLARGHEQLLAPMLEAGLRHGGSLTLSGVDEASLAAARTLGRCHDLLTRPSPYAVLDRGAEAWLAGLGSSTRAHLRRSRRRYQEQAEVTLRRAAGIAEAQHFLDAMAALHQAAWIARGKPGAFANPAFVGFLRTLLERGVPRGEVEMLHVAAGPRTIGYLCNFRLGGRVSTYQGGFDYAGAGPQQTPGLTCHHLAIEDAAESQCRIYDFLAGEARYKTSLADRRDELHWLELVRHGSPRDRALRLRARLKRG